MVITTHEPEANQAKILFREDMTQSLRKKPLLLPEYAAAEWSASMTAAADDNETSQQRCLRPLTANCLPKSKLQSASSKAESSLPWHLTPHRDIKL